MNDPTIDALDPALREGLGTYWMSRAGSELRVSEAFRLLGAELEETGMSDVVRELVAQTVADEIRHSELCRQLASRYAGREMPSPVIDTVTLPAFPDVAPQLQSALHVMALSCVNETIASSWLSGCLALATTPLAREANRVHLREEIAHARLGWAHLASPHVTPETRAALGGWLGRILRANVPQWFRPDEGLPVEGVPDHGVPSLSATRSLVVEAIADVVLPGFEEIGVDVDAGAGRGRAWLGSLDVALLR